MNRKTITEPAPAPADEAEPRTAEDVLAEALSMLRGPGGYSFIDPLQWDTREIARSLIGVFPAGWSLRPTET